MTGDYDTDELGSNEIECPNCGEHVYYEVLVCPRCGLHFYPSEDDEENQPVRRSSNAGLFEWLRNIFNRNARK